MTMDVGVAELKAHLSEYLDRAARGEVIQVTERGRAKAILAPLPGRVRLEQGIADGWVAPGDGSAPRPARRRFRATRTVQAMMDEDRGE